MIRQRALGQLRRGSQGWQFRASVRNLSQQGWSRGGGGRGVLIALLGALHSNPGGMNRINTVKHAYKYFPGLFLNLGFRV